MKHNEFNAIRDGKYGDKYAEGHPLGGKVWLRPARTDEIPLLHALNVSEISPEVGTERVMLEVHERNPDTFWVVEHLAPDDTDPKVVGCYGFLFLTDTGFEALKGGILDRKDPPLRYITPAGMRPAAIYVWTMIAHGLARILAPLVVKAVEPYVDVPCYTICMTERGLNAARRRGFVPVDATVGDRGALVMLPTRQLEVLVASNAEHLQMGAYIRGATFGAEQLSPYREEFDGNDFCASHLIGFVDGEPAAVLRIRFFGSFAKLERLAVLKRFRRTTIKHEIMRHAIDICRRKGYTKLYGHAQIRLVSFYAKFGFRPIDRNERLVFADHEYVEIEAEVEPHEDPITMGSNPYVIIRPEGAWDLPGVMDVSAIRPPTNPIG